MRIYSRLTVVGFMTAAAFAVGSVALAAPASATETMMPVRTTVTDPVGVTALAAYSSGTQAVQQSGAKWRGGAARDLDTGTWRATVTRGEVTILLGHYETEKEARKAGRKEARELNGVMDGPGCDPPFVFC